MKSIVLLATLLASLVPGFAVPRVTETPGDDARHLTLTFVSPSLARGSAPGVTEEGLVVLLPGSYESSPGRRYPVVYTLHGYGDNLDQLMNVVEPLLEGTPLPEFILVGVSGGNSFYADSAVHGDVARMLVDEVVPVVDERYRTVAKPQGRMLAGFSMGGYVAWTLGLGHADVFASVWASCPGAFDATGVRDALGQWRSGMFYDYAATFAPIFYDTASGKAPLPRFDGTPEDNRYLHDLEKGFGDASKKIAAYQARKPRLAAVRFDYGTDDTFGWIVNGTKALAGQFQAAGIPTTIEGWPANHQITDDMVTAGLFPLIRQVFQGLWSTPAKAAAVGRGDLFYQA